MRSIILVFSVCLLFLGASLTYSSPMPQSDDSAYAGAYDRWTRAIESNPTLGEPFWLRSDIGPTAMRVAVTELLSFGPNIVPFLVKEMRQETDSLRLYRLVLLLNTVAGINLYYDSGVQNVHRGSAQLRDRFINDWDSGKFLNATQLLRGTWQKSNQDEISERIDPRKLIQVRRYGVFAIPFIVENIESTNSSELFAAFLIISGDSDGYDQYLESPSKHFAKRDQKLSSIKSWVGKNEKKMDKLTSLHDQIKVLAANPAK